MKESAHRFNQEVDGDLSARADTAVKTARLTEVVAVLLILYDAHKGEKVQLRSAWRPQVTLFRKTWGDDALPRWLSDKYEAVRALR